MLIKVVNGTGAGVKVRRQAKRGEWAHVCDHWPEEGVVKGRLLAYVYARCPFCGCKRP